MVDELNDWVSTFVAYATLAQMLWRVLEATKPEKRKSPRRKRRRKRKKR